MKKFILTLVVAFSFITVEAQDNGLYVLDLTARTIDSLGAVPTPTFYSASTTSFKGGHGSWQHVLPLNIQNIVPCSDNSAITERRNMSQIGDVTDYPFRTFIKVGRKENGVFKGLPISATMIGSRFAITDHFSIDYVFNFRFPPSFSLAPATDSIFVLPSYTNGNCGFAECPQTRVIKIYQFKRNLSNNSTRNFCLLELDQPLGLFIGWMGMAYNNDNLFFEQRLFQKLTLPVGTFVPTQYNGDTMYHSYGYIINQGNEFTVLGGWLNANYMGPVVGFTNGLISCGAQSGDQGSPMFFTNNTDSTILYGVCGSITNNYYHSLITPDVFAAFKNLTGETTTRVQSNFKPVVLLYPNPVHNELVIETDYVLKEYELSIININGMVLLRRKNINSITRISLVHLPPGIYFIQLINKNETLTRKIVKQ